MSDSDKKEVIISKQNRIKMLIGNIEAFSFDGDNDLSEYLSRMEHMFKINEVADNLKISFLISFAGKDFHERVNVVIKPKKLESFKYSELVDLIKKEFKPVKNIRAERFKFLSRNMKEGESIEEFAVDLKNLATTCNYGEALDEMLCDKLILSIRQRSIQKRLMEEPMSKTFSQICEIALTQELTIKNVDEMQQQHQNASVNWVANRQNFRVTARGNMKDHFRSQPTSSRMHFQNKPREQEPRHRRDVICYRCNQKGHYAYQCENEVYRRLDRNPKREMKRTDSRNPRLHAVRDEVEVSTDEDCVSEANSENEDDEALYVGRVDYGKKGKYAHFPHFVKLLVDKIIIEFEVDTGASITVMSRRDFECFFPKKNITRFDRAIKVISGKDLDVYGTFEVEVFDMNEIRYGALPIVVINAIVNFKPLLGRNWLDIIFKNWQKVFSINAIKEEGNFVQRYSKVFDDNYSEPILKYTADIFMDKEAKPSFHNAYTVPYGLRDKVEKEIERLVGLGILLPVSYSKWSSPVVAVVKKNGAIRLCMDCRISINKYVDSNPYPLPIMEDIFNEFCECKYFSKIDLAGAFTQLRVNESSQEFLTINTHKGLFRYTRLPFGVKSAPAIFQQVIDSILKDIRGVRAYMDDILIGGRTREECKARVNLVLHRLTQFNVKANSTKCEFVKSNMEFLGFEISEKGVSPKKDKMKAILNAEEPKDVSTLKSYLGLLNFYGNFIPNLSSELNPLYELTKKHSVFQWTQQCQTAFARSKELLENCKMLTLYNPNLPLGIVCDASSYGVGGVLFHIIDGLERPIKFYSSTLNKAERNYSQIEREALAIVFTLKKCHKYVYGRKFCIYSDHKPLQFIFGEKKVNSVSSARIQRWSLYLSQYDYEIKYRKGGHMGNADCLSRLPLPGKTNISNIYINFCDISGEIPIRWENIALESKKDEMFSRIISYIQSGSWPNNGETKEENSLINQKLELTLANGCILRGNKVVVPPILRNHILSTIHTGHPGIVRMKKLARSLVWWPSLDKNIDTFVKTCDPCQQINVQAGTFLKEWPKTTHPFERVHIDFFHFKEKTFLILFDSYSKWIEVKSMKKTEADPVIAELKSIFASFGLPKEIVSDNGPPFRSKLFKRFCAVNGVNLPETPTIHPQSNGAAERSVKTVKIGLKKLLADNRTKLLSLECLLTKFLFEYRNTPNTVTNQTPAEMIFMYTPRTIIEFIKPQGELGKIIEEDKAFKIHSKIWYKSRNMSSWSPAEIQSQISAVIYIIKINGVLKRAHRDQIKLRRERLPFISSSPIIYTKPDEEDQEGNSKNPKEVKQDSSSSPRKLRPREKLRPPDRFRTA